MKKPLLSLFVAALLGSLAFQASATSRITFDTTDLTIARAERPEKVEKPERKEKVGAIDSSYLLAREASERPRGSDHERPGDRQRRGGRG